METEDKAKNIYKIKLCKKEKVGGNEKLKQVGGLRGR